MKYNEEDMIRSLQQADVGAMKMMFDNYYQALCIFSLRYLGSYSQAEDVVQDVLAAFWEAKKGKTFSGSVRAYLFTAVRSASLNVLKKARQYAFTLIDDQLELLFDDFDLIESDELARRKESLEQAIEALPPGCRQVFRLIVVEGMQKKEVAALLNVSVNTVKTQHARALSLLRERLDTLILFLLLRHSLFTSFS